MSSIVARMARLSALAQGLSREVHLWRDAAHPLTYLELKAYLNALQHGIGRLEDARVVLGKALDRIAQDEALMGDRQEK